LYKDGAMFKQSDPIFLFSATHLYQLKKENVQECSLEIESIYFDLSFYEE